MSYDPEFVERFLLEFGATPPAELERIRAASKQTLVVAVRQHIERWRRDGHPLEAIAQRFSELGVTMSKATLRTCLRRSAPKARAGRASSARPRAPTPTAPPGRLGQDTTATADESIARAHRSTRPLARAEAVQDTVTTTPQHLAAPVSHVKVDLPTNGAPNAALNEAGSRERMTAPEGEQAEPIGHGRSKRKGSAEVEVQRTAEASDTRPPSIGASDRHDSDPTPSGGSEVASDAKARLTEIRSRAGSTSSAFAVPRRKPLHDL
jgi:hypothetical protein